MADSPQHATLVAATVTTFTFGADYSKIEVLNVNGAGAIYFTWDGTDPAVSQTGSHVVPNVAGASVERTIYTEGKTVVKVISAGTPVVCVTAY